jgi:hypothetical protein
MMVNKQYPDTEEGAVEYLEAQTCYDPEQVRKVTKSNISDGVYAIDFLSGTRVVVFLMGYGFQKDDSNNSFIVMW